MTNSVERTKEISGNVEDLGSYHAEGGRIKADLNLRVRITTLAMMDSGTDWYVADFNFYTEPQWRDDKEGFSVKVHYSFNTLGEIFKRVKRADKGIEMMLASPTDYNWDSRAATDVINCILSLEQRTRHIPEERELAAKERYKYVYGKEKNF